MDNFFLQVQGSGRVLLTDGPDSGKTIRVAYADHNGQPYASIGRWLIDRGELSADQASMQNIRAWAQRNPKRVPEMLNANPAVVFFREEAVVDPEQGPKGAYGIALAPQRSVAVDAGFVPLGTPVFLATTYPASDRPLQRLVFAQDTGTAIRGAGRLLLGLRRGSRAAGGPHEAARPDVAAVAQTGRGAQRAMTHQIVVCGAGIVGLSTALALARRGQRVAVLAPRASVPAAEADHYHPRVYAISPASQRFLAGLGVWDAMPAARLTPVQAMEIHGDADGEVHLNAWQAALPQLAWIVESGEIERVLIQAVRLFGIPWIEDRCAGYANGEIQTENGARIRAELFVGADGAASPLREAAGLKHEAVPYKDTGLVVHLTPNGRTRAPPFSGSATTACWRCCRCRTRPTARRCRWSGPCAKRPRRGCWPCRRASRPPRWKDCWRTRPRAGWAS